MNAKRTFIDLYLKYSAVMLASGSPLYFGRVLFILLSFGLLIALILYPFCNWLEKHNWPRGLAMLFTLTIVVVLFAGKPAHTPAHTTLAWNWLGETRCRIGPRRRMR